MNDTPIELVLSRIPDAKKSGKGWTARCPAHDDRHPSLTITEGDDGRALLRCHAGCTVDAICAAIGLSMADLFPANSDGRSKRQPDKGTGKVYPTANDAVAALEHRLGKRSALWTYHDANGEPVAVIVRWNLSDGKKDIRPVSRHGDDWIVAGMPAPRPLYRLADLAGADRVYVCEGEKAADAARSLGLIATTSAHGCQSAGKTDWSPMASREVVILPDNDDEGRTYKDSVASILWRLKPCPVVKVAELPNLPEKGDIFDWVESHDAVDPNELRRQVEALADGAKQYKPGDLLSAAPVIICMADVKPEPIRWLWPGRIALGKLTLLVGDPGLGKSLVTLDIASRLSNGAPWPDSPSTSTQAGGVVLLSAEDDIADTVRPRLDAAGAEVRRIFTLTGTRRSDEDGEYQRSIDLSRDLACIETAICQTPDCRMVVIDPITAYLGRTDSHKNAEIRGLLAPLSELAGRYRVAVVAVTHLNKNNVGPAIYRSMGSLAFVAAARATWVVSKDKKNPQRRLMLPIKNNLAGDVLGMAYTIETPGGNNVPALAWEPEPVEVSADEALEHSNGEGGRGAVLSEAVDWLRDALGDGAVSTKELKQQAGKDGIASRTLDRAKSELGVKASREGFGGSGRWVWTLPDQRAPNTPTPKSLAAFGNLDALWTKPEENGGGSEGEGPRFAKERQDSDGGGDWGEI